MDLLLGGSPCQGFSFAGKQLNFEDPRSKLFFDYVKALNILKPKYFIFENVKMKKESEQIISQYLGVEPIEINSSLVSAQNRRRLYWTNIPGVVQPQDRGILLKDIVLNDAFPVVIHNIYGGFKEKKVRVFEGKSPTIRTAAGGGHIPYFVKKDLIHSEKAIEYMNKATRDGRAHWDFGHHFDIRNPKSATVVANFFKGVPYNVFKDWDCIRKFHPVECERLQTLPDGYTEGISNTQRYKSIGNGWTVDVIAHILSFIPDKKLNNVVSLFDGISCGQVALERAGFTYKNYFASEIDKYAIHITQKNYPNTIQLGDVTQINWDEFTKKHE
jgi:site-specific DNA-cytosine methylase